MDGSSTPHPASAGPSACRAVYPTFEAQVSQGLAEQIRQRRPWAVAPGRVVPRLDVTRTGAHVNGSRSCGCMTGRLTTQHEDTNSTEAAAAAAPPLAHQKGRSGSSKCTYLIRRGNRVLIRF